MAVVQKTDTEKPSAQFQIQTCREVQSLIDMAVVTVVGDTIGWMEEKSKT
jgi:hypothetical protein